MMTSAAPVHTPADLADALALRAAHPAAWLLAGGTDIMVYLEAHAIDPPAFIDLWGLPELRGVDTQGDHIRVGACADYTTLIDEPAVRAHLPPLVEAARTVGARQIQNRGTIGGNIANASPAGDTMPVLLALDAVLELQSAARGLRAVPLADFYTGYKRTVMAPDELIAAVRIPKPAKADRLHFRKVGTRLAQSISKVVLGGRLRLDGDTVTEARLGWGSVAATPVRSPKAEAALVGQALSPSTIEAAVAALDGDITPIDDVRSTAGYRVRVAGRILRSWLESLRG